MLPKKKIKLVYVLEAESCHRIKIGVSGNVKNRFYDLLASGPLPLSLWGVIYGGEQMERKLHRAYLGLRSHYEWFKTDDHRAQAMTQTLVQLMNDTPYKLASQCPNNHTENFVYGYYKPLAALRRWDTENIPKPLEVFEAWRQNSK